MHKDHGFRPNFHRYTIDWNFHNFHLNNIGYGIWPNFHPDTIDLGI